MNAASIFGRTVPAFLAPRYGVYNMAIPFTACMGILMYSILGIVNAGGLVVFAIIYGFFSGGGSFE